MTRNFKILVCGMPHAMANWAFDTLCDALSGTAMRHFRIEPGSSEEEAFCEVEGLALGLCHHYSQALADAANFVVYSYRDVRAAAAAMGARQPVESSAWVEPIASWIAAMDDWMVRADIVLRHEVVLEDPSSAIETLCGTLARRGLPADTALVGVACRTLQQAAAHKEEAQALVDVVGSRFSEWLQAHGYCTGVAVDRYGQEVEYQIAAAVLAQLAGGIVVDVGVERGTFVDLALRSGAGSVIGFEPLPRHLADLHRRADAVSNFTILPFAVSDRSGVAQFHIALDRAGNELDYHHSLADLGDSATVVRSAQVIDVRTIALKDLVRDGELPASIDFLKIDTDGHDLSVMHGLGALRPRVVMAEFWDTLPDSSGDSPYALHDLIDWGSANGYDACLVVRHHRGAVRVDWQAPWTIPGDWGNVFLFRTDFDLSALRPELQRISGHAHWRMCQHLQRLESVCEEKEGVIQDLLVARADVPPAVQPSARDASSKEDGATPAVHALEAQLLAKEQIIQEQRRALRAFHAAIPVLRPALPMLRIGRDLVRLLQPKLGRLHHHEPIPARWPPARRSLDRNPPTMALVTPSFRQARFLGRTIDSVLQQEYPALEYFVQDGGSNDGSVEVLQAYGDRLTGWVSAPDGGQSQAINAGFARTRGDIMAWLNSDDLLLPGALAIVGEYFEANPQVDVVYGHRILIDEEDREIGRWVLPPHSDAVLSWADFVPQETLFWRRSLWEKVGGIDESFRFAMDWDLLLRFRDAGARMVRLPHFLGAFRIHEAQKTSAAIHEVGTEEMARLRRRVHGRDVSYPEIRRALVPYILRHLQSDLASRIQRRFHRATESKN
jgi:FkbM family methyltransferase